MEKTILAMLEKLPDHRKGNAIRHILSEIIMIGLLCFICNGNCYAGMHEFGKAHEEKLKKLLKLPYGIPSPDTFERVFQKIKPKYLARHFREWVDDIKFAASNAGLIVALDGKTIQQSKRLGKKAVHVVTAFASQLRLVLGEVAVNDKSNEITAIPELLDMFCQKGMLITIDAMGTQKDISKKIISHKADYVLAVKGNQKTLHTDIGLLMEHEIFPMDKDELRKNGQYERTIEKGHGRIETRECFISRDIHWLSTGTNWDGLAGFGTIVSKREVFGKNPTFSSRSFIFSLKSTDAAELLRIVRSHWAIENNLHWSLDVTFKEDDSRATIDNSPENLNILRKEALRLMGQETSFKASMRMKRLRCAWDLDYAFKVIDVN